MVKTRIERWMVEKLLSDPDEKSVTRWVAKLNAESSFPVKCLMEAPFRSGRGHLEYLTDENLEQNVLEVDLGLRMALHYASEMGLPMDEAQFQALVLSKLGVSLNNVCGEKED